MPLKNNQDQHPLRQRSITPADAMENPDIFPAELKVKFEALPVEKQRVLVSVVQVLAQAITGPQP